MSEEEQFTGPTKWGNPFKNPRGQQQIVLRGKGRATNHLNLKLHIKLMATIFISAWKTANAGPRGKGYKFDHTFKLVCKQTIQYFMTCENCFHPKFNNQEMVVLHNIVPDFYIWSGVWRILQYFQYSWTQIRTSKDKQNFRLVWIRPEILNVKTKMKTLTQVKH